MFSLGSSADTFPLPGNGMTIKKLEFPLKGKLATWTRERLYVLLLYFIGKHMVVKGLKGEREKEGNHKAPLLMHHERWCYLCFQLRVVQQAQRILGRLHHVHGH